MMCSVLEIPSSAEGATALVGATVAVPSRNPRIIVDPSNIHSPRKIDAAVRRRSKRQQRNSRHGSSPNVFTVAAALASSRERTRNEMTPKYSPPHNEIPMLVEFPVPASNASRYPALINGIPSVVEITMVSSSAPAEGPRQCFFKKKQTHPGACQNSPNSQRSTRTASTRTATSRAGSTRTLTLPTTDAVVVATIVTDSPSTSDSSTSSTGETMDRNHSSILDTKGCQTPILWMDQSDSLPEHPIPVERLEHDCVSDNPPSIVNTGSRSRSPTGHPTPNHDDDDKNNMNDDEDRLRHRRRVSESMIQKLFDDRKDIITELFHGYSCWLLSDPLLD